MLATFTNSFFAGRRKNSAKVDAPTQITGLQIWYDASNAASISAAGGAVNNWQDLNNGAKNAKATNANQKPTYIASSTNGLPAIQFNGTTNLMSISPWNSPDQLSNIPAFSMSIVAKPLSYGASGARYLTGTNASDLIIGYTGNCWAVRAAGGTGWAQSAPGSAVSTATPHIFTLIYDGNAGSTLNGDARNNARLKFRIDKVQQNITWPNQVVSNLTNASNSTMYLASNMGANGFFNVEILEVTMFTKALNSSEIAQVETYLSNHWNI